MNLDQAVTDLSIQLEVQRLEGNSYSADAIKLGIEALRHLQKQRRFNLAFKYELLPGETKEKE